MVEQEGNVGKRGTGGCLEGAVLVACLEEEASPSIYSLSCPQHVAFGSWVMGGPDTDDKAERTEFHNASQRTLKHISHLTQQGPFRDFSWGQNRCGCLQGLETASSL